MNILNQTGVRELVGQKINELRKRLLDGTRRNPLINVPLRANSTTIIRVVDEVPDILRYNLENGQEMRLISLPPLEEELPDEQSDQFLDKLFSLRSSDEDFLSKLNELDPDDEDYDTNVYLAERELKDKIREHLNLPKRQTTNDTDLSIHAKNHGINPSYLLPDSEQQGSIEKHNDLDIQTLLLPEKLKKIGKSVVERGKSYERETGVNVLHAAFGLLDWKNPGEKAPYKSPLLLLEVKIDRRQSRRGAEFFICGIEKITINTTLKQKLFSEHKIILPDFEDEPVEDYLKKIDDMKPPGWEWNSRREVLTGIFPSSKIAMYHDINPENPNISENEIIAKLLATAGSSEDSYAEVYDVDSPDITRQVPYLVMDADASQYSALVDVSNGKNLSIEGPPGTGKSQTIVNIIASALADEKKVLFVAEKLTALEVVRNRLQAVGLGEFALSLQAGRAAREKVYESIEERLLVSRKNSEAAERHKDKQDVLFRKRSSLQDYLNTLASDFYETGFTVYQIIGRAIATEQNIINLPKALRRLKINNCENLSKDHIEEILSDAEVFCDRFEKIKQMPTLWLKSRKNFISRDNLEDITDLINELSSTVPELEELLKSSEIGLLVKTSILDADYGKITSDLFKIGEFNSICGSENIEYFVDNNTRTEARKYKAQLEELGELTDALVFLHNPKDPLIESKLNEALKFCNEAGGTINSLTQKDNISKLSDELKSAEAVLEKLKASPSIWRDRPNTKISQLKKEASDLSQFSSEILHLTIADDERKARSHFQAILNSKKNLKEELVHLQKKIPGAGNHQEGVIGTVLKDGLKAGALSFLSGSFKPVRTYYSNDLQGSEKDSKQEIIATLESYLEWIRKKKNFEKDHIYRQLFIDLFKGLDTDEAMLKEAVERCELCQSMAGDDKELENFLLKDDLSTILPIKEVKPYYDDFSLKTLSEYIQKKNASIEHKNFDLETAEKCEALFKDKSMLGASKIRMAIEGVSQLKKQKENLATNIPDHLANLSIDQIEMKCEFGEFVSQTSQPDFYCSSIKNGVLEELLENATDLSNLKTKTEIKLNTLDELLSLNGEFVELRDFLSNMDIFKKALERPDLLLERGTFRRVEDKIRSHGFSDLIEHIVSEDLSFQIEELPRVIDGLIAKSMADHCLSKYTNELNNYNGQDFNRIRKEIIQKDKELLETSKAASRENVVSNAIPPSGNNIGRKSTYTNMGLIFNELNKKRNRVGIRELTRRAGSALLELKPCWMMSPLAVAQYAHAKLDFDLVVIDEASQMTPENAIGAISRAKQIVVVGDTKQLPPTSFFQKIVDDTDVDEDLREDSESILDLANMAFMPIRQLRWHYRSRHSALIEFSNQMMYKGELTIFPNANENNDDLGVELVEVNGFYLNRRNEIEAKEIVKAAVNHMENKPHYSLGLCTMNSDQRELIEEEFERVRDSNKKVQDFCEKWELINDGLESFFIKNLETIQGDERDYMFISTLYGPEPNSKKVLQRFGPINSVNGHRRLNVLFSRAKHKMVTFTSMKPNDILVEGARNFGVKMFSSWLEYSKTGHVSNYEKTSGVTESPFEDHVAQQIEALGCEVVPQVGVAGFRIDLGVKHPNWPYGFLLGVECDGATYHSSKSSRDRDRLRQEVLEGLDWKLHRIWSTDWFKNPKAEMEALKNKIYTVLDEVTNNNKEVNYKTDLITDTNTTGEKETSPEEVAERSQQLTEILIQQGVQSSGNLAKVGSRIQLESLKDQKQFLFTLVEGFNDPEKGQIGIHTAMGQELLDCEESDVVKIQSGSYLNEVKVVTISN